MNLEHFLIGINKKIKLPPGLKYQIQKLYDSFELRGRKWIEEDPFRNEPPEWKGRGNYPFTLGIITEFWHLHWPYIAACRDIGVSYKLIDIASSRWMELVSESKCDAFVARPSVQLGTWKMMYDERLKILAREKSLRVYPDYEALYLWESKRRVAYWLDHHQFPHPRTWIFYNKLEALEFAERCDIPVVYKSDSGSGASGVLIFKNRNKLRQHIRNCFDKGYLTYRKAQQDNEKSFIILQEYLAGIREWRIVRIGDSFFGYEKVKQGDFHSGSHQFSYGQPPEEALNMTKLITDRGNFRSMDIDLFICSDGTILINELQAIFGQAGSREICRIGDQSGRMTFDISQQKWVFEPGTFCSNYLCNLRIKDVLEQLSNPSITTG